MNNNKQSIKLYTEKDAIYFFECGKNFHQNGNLPFEIVEQFTTPVQLPTEEQMDKISYETFRDFPNNTKEHPEWKYNQDINAPRKRRAFIKGAKWVLDEIKGDRK